MALKVGGSMLSGLCWNLTIVRDAQLGGVQVADGPFPVQLIAYVNASGLDKPEDDATTRDKHALLYIVVVLLFYSTGIVVAIVNYLKGEKKEIEEEKTYEDYAVFRSDPDKMARYFRVQKMISYLNEVEETKKTATLKKERLSGKPAVALQGTSEEHSMSKVAARFSLGTEHLPRILGKQKLYFQSSEPDNEARNLENRGRGFARFNIRQSRSADSLERVKDHQREHNQQQHLLQHQHHSHQQQQQPGIPSVHKSPNKTLVSQV